MRNAVLVALAAILGACGGGVPVFNPEAGTDAAADAADAAPDLDAMRSDQSVELSLRARVVADGGFVDFAAQGPVSGACAVRTSTDRVEFSFSASDPSNNLLLTGAFSTTFLRADLATVPAFYSVAGSLAGTSFSSFMDATHYGLALKVLPGPASGGRQSFRITVEPDLGLPFAPYSASDTRATIWLLGCPVGP